MLIVLVLRLNIIQQDMGMQGGKQMAVSKDIEIHESCIVLSESTKVNVEKKEIEAVIIKSGISKRKNYYSPECLEAAAPLFIGKKMYIDHPDPNSAAGQGKAARSLRDWVATIKESYYVPEEKGIGAKIGIRDNWLWDKIASANAEGWLGEIGLSINAVGKTRIGKMGDETVHVVEAIVRPHSVDFVTDASAGGTIQQVNESEIPQLEGEMAETVKMTIEQLQESNPELVDQIATAVREQVLAESATTIDQMAEGMKQIVNEFIDQVIGETAQMYESTLQGIGEVGGIPEGEPIEEGQVPDGVMDVIADRDQRIAELVEAVQAGQQGSGETDERVEELENQLIAVTSNTVAERKLTEARIPDSFKLRLLPAMIGKSPDEMETIIEEAEGFYQDVAKEMGHRNVVGMGGSDGKGGEEKQTSFDKLFGV